MSHLRYDQVMSLLNAWAFAESRNTPLGLHVVVHWERLDLIAGQSILQAQATFLDRLSKWLRKRHKPLAYLWTIEFSPRKGHHTHLLVAVGRLHARTLAELLRGLPYLLVGDDRPLHPCVIVVERNNCPLPHDPSRRGWVARTEDQRRGLIGYICKGLHPAAAAETGIHAENQGEVRFRRCGVSRSLDWTARRRAGWQEQPLEQFDFSDLAEKRLSSLARASQRRSGAPGRPLHTRPLYSPDGPSRGSTGLAAFPWKERRWHELRDSRQETGRGYHRAGVPAMNHARNYGADTEQATRPGTFRPGNPGRPLGARNKVTLAAMALLEGEAEALTRRCVELALGGDSAAMRLCIERLLPKGRAVRLQLPLRTLAALDAAMETVSEALAAGTIVLDEVTTLTGLIDARRRVLETTELERRLAVLEQAKAS